MLATLSLMAVVVFSALAAVSPDAEVTAFLDLMPSSPPFTKWLESSGETPPDFSAMPSYAPLPLPLSPVINETPIPITDISSWRKERERLLGELQHWILESLFCVSTRIA